MDPIHLHFVLTCAVNCCALSPVLASHVFAQALRQIAERWPLAGCAVKYDSPLSHVITVGRN